MKVLIVHNDYGKYSGEEAVVDKMSVIMQSLGHQVVQLRMTTSGLRESLKGKIKGFINGIYCPSGVKSMKDVLLKEKPDIVNVHNLFPFISPAALRECKNMGIPVVMTIHNFRLMCPTGLFMRNGKPCELCLEKGVEWNCIKYNCEQSLLKSIGYAARSAVARIKKHYLECVDVFACITAFQKEKLIQAGFPRDRIVVIPNSIDVNDKYTPIGGNYVAYSGRISREKGVDLIIESARRHPEIPFKLAGEVRDKDIIDNIPDNVELMGYLSGDALIDFYYKARFFVMASRWYEGFPMSILEAASFHKPMIAPNHGGFPEIIGIGNKAIGLLTIPSDFTSLDRAIVHLWNDYNECLSFGEKAYKKLKFEYSFDVIKHKWDSLLKSLVFQ